MKAATLAEIKRELSTVGEERLVEICLRLGKYKVENKELMTYMLFEAGDEQAFVQEGKREIEEAFQAIPNKNLYYFKKSLRKILRMVNKQSRYSGIPQTELELRIQFCKCLKESGVAFEKSPVIKNLYLQQLKKIAAVLRALPEDLQYDYEEESKILNIKP